MTDPPIPDTRYRGIFCAGTRGIGGGNHLRHFNDPVTLQFARNKILRQLSNQEKATGVFRFTYLFYQQCLIRLQFHIRQPDGSALRGVILSAQSVQTCPCRVLGKVEQPHQRFLAALAHQRQHAGVVAVPCGHPRIRGKAGVCTHLAQLLHALPQLVLQRALPGALLCVLPVEFLCGADCGCPPHGRGRFCSPSR